MNNHNESCLSAISITYLLTYGILFPIAYIVGKHLYSNLIFAYSIAAISFVVSIAMGIHYSKCKSKMEQMESDMRQKEYKMRKEYNNKEFLITQEMNKYKHQIEQIKSIMADEKPFSLSASLYADVQSCVFDDAAKYLKTKKHPAHGTARDIQIVMKKNYLNAEMQYKTILYKLESLLGVFPELETYIEDEQLLSELSLFKDYNDLSQNRDKSRDYLTADEWQSLSVTERNQLAFDRWKKRDKSKLVIGLLYEMYISYLLRQKGHSVNEYGIKHGVSDLGRDIISHKDGYTYIYQCKRWSQNKEIHENIVCQLFGTVMEYKISHNSEKVKAVLVSTTSLSPMALEFAKRLDIDVLIKPMDEFPMIKCNINAGQKIYHLPFDQQYWNTDISKPGELYATTVKEAEKNGFRRAMRHFL